MQHVSRRTEGEPLGAELEDQVTRVAFDGNNTTTDLELMGEDYESNSLSLHPVSDGHDRLQRSAALFLLSAKECFHLTQSALNFVTQQVQQMVSFAIDDIEKVLKKYLNDCGVMQSTGLDAQFEAMRDPFSSLQTEYLQTKYYQERL